MPRRCCIPRCKSNYSSTLKTMGAVSVYQFPKNEELRKKWINAIPRTNWTPTQSSCVCRLHFKNEDIMNPTELDYQRFDLKQNAVPSIFKPFSTLITESNNARVFKRKVVDDSIKDFTHLVNEYPRRIQMPKDWNTKLIENIFHFFTLEVLEDDLNIKNQITVYQDLSFNVLMNGVTINISELNCFKSSPELKLTKWSQLQFLLKVLSTELQTRNAIFFEDTKFMIEI